MDTSRKIRSSGGPSLRLAFAASFPAERFELTPIGGEPLTGGFVENIHPNGPEIYARHVYVLNGT